MKRKCPNCGETLNIGRLLRQRKRTQLQAQQAKINGKLGGRPRLKKTPEQGF
jgi:hypothetical protein